MVGQARASWWWFLAWVPVGAGAASVISVIGIFVLPGVVIASALLLFKPAAARSVSGALSGIGALGLVVGFINRHGPNSCSQTGGSSGAANFSYSCVQYLNPWPWLIAGAVLVLGGIAAQLVARRTA